MILANDRKWGLERDFESLRAGRHIPGRTIRAITPPAPRTAEWRSGARWDDHHHAAGPDVGHRCDTVLYRGGWLVLVLRGHRSLRGRARGLAHREDRRSLGRPRAAASGCAPRLRPLRERRR